MTPNQPIDQLTADYLQGYSVNLTIIVRCNLFAHNQEEAVAKARRIAERNIVPPPYSIDEIEIKAEAVNP